MPNNESRGAFGTSRSEQTIKHQIRSSIPTPYESGVGVFGGRFDERNGKLLFLMRGIDVTSLAKTLRRQIDSVDRVGDRFLRRFDDHLMSDKVASWIQTRIQGIVREAPFAAINKLTVRSKRSRGGPKQIVEHAQELHWEEEGMERALSDHYGEYRELGIVTGIDVRDPNIFKRGAAFQDIIRGDTKNVDIETNRWALYQDLGKFIRNIHAHSSVGVGELLTADTLVYRDAEGRQRFTLNIPDILYRQHTTHARQSLSDSLIGVPQDAKTVRTIPSRSEQQATDLLDFVTSIAFEEYRRSLKDGLTEQERWGKVSEALSLVVSGYLSGPDDASAFRVDGKKLTPMDIVRATKSLAYRGRLSFQGDESVITAAKDIHSGKVHTTDSHKHWQAFHNQYRFGIDEISKNVDEQQLLVGHVRERVLTSLGFQTRA